MPANFMCGVWVALEDVDESNGALHYYPRSHKLPLYDLNDLGLDTKVENYPRYEEFLQALFGMGRFDKHVVNMKKGEALIWSANLFHGGNPILDPSRTRLSQVTHFYFERAMYYTPMYSKPFLGDVFYRFSGLRDIRNGEPLTHYYNGQVVDAAALARTGAPGEAPAPAEAPAPVETPPSVSRRAQIRRVAKKALPPITAALLVSNAVLWSKWKGALDKDRLPE